MTPRPAVITRARRGRPPIPGLRESILREAEGKSKDFETAAKKNFDRAVRYILDQVAGGK